MLRSPAWAAWSFGAGSIVDCRPSRSSGSQDAPRIPLIHFRGRALADNRNESLLGMMKNTSNIAREWGDEHTFASYSSVLNLAWGYVEPKSEIPARSHGGSGKISNYWRDSPLLSRANRSQLFWWRIPRLSVGLKLVYEQLLTLNTVWFYQAYSPSKYGFFTPYWS